MKKILLSLFWIITLWLINFWSCFNVSDFITYIDTQTVNINQWSVHKVFETTSSSDYWTYCIKITSITSGRIWAFWYNNSLAFNRDWFSYFYSDFGVPFYVCSYVNVSYLLLYAQNWSIDITYDLFKLNNLLDYQVPVMTSFECQQNYDLIPISSVDSNYCEINNLCPSWWWECIEGSWFSDIYIYSNNRYFPLTWTNSVFINLPQYLNYNYDYSNWWNDLDIDLWYSVDDSYLSSVKDLQLTTPNQVDLNNIVSWLLPLFVPWLVVILFLYFVFRFLKKIF